jgi:hypothetical protein
LILPVLGGNVWFSWVSAIIIARATEYLRLPFSISLQSNFVDGLFSYPFPLNFQLLPEYQLAFFGDKLNPVVFFLTASVLVYASCFATARSFGFRPIAGMWSGLAFFFLCMPVGARPIIRPSSGGRVHNGCRWPMAFQCC